MKKYWIILSFLTFFANPALAFSVKHDFAVQLGVFNASKTQFTYSISPREYSVASSVATSGMIDTLYPFKANYSTTGKIKGKELETTSYKYQSKSRFTKRTKELVYNDKGDPIIRISSKNDKEKKVQITQETDNKDTTDLQTVFAELAIQYNKVKFCANRMQVFDGKRRFDVIFKDEGKVTLPKNDKGPYFGEASKCSMYIDKLGEKGDDLLWEMTQDKPIYFWIMEDKQNKVPFIAKILVENTPLGKLEAYTKKITVEK